MILQATYPELNDIISKKAPVKGLSLSYRSADTVTVTVSLNVLGFISQSVSADIRLLSVDGSRVTAEIDAGGLGNIVLDKAKDSILEKAPAGLVESLDNRVAVLNLEAVPQLKSLFETLTLRGLSFSEEALCLDAVLK